MNYFDLYVVLGVLLITALAMNVSRVRMKEKIGNGDGNNVSLKKAIRAHVNTLEHVLPFALVVFVLSQIGLQKLYLAIFALGFVIIRVLHSYGMLASKFKIRQMSAGLTYLFEVIGCLTILFKLVVA